MKINHVLRWAAILMLPAISMPADIKVDVGGEASTAETGWIPWITPDRVGDGALSQAFTADFDDAFTVSIDKTDTRRRGAIGANVPLANMLRSSFKDDSPIVLRLQELNAGAYEMTLWLHDGNVNAKPTVDIVVTDADEANRLAVDNQPQSWGPGPVFSGDGGSAVLGPTNAATAKFLFRSDGANEVVIKVSDNDDVITLYPVFAAGHPDWNETFIAGFQIARVTAPVNPPPVVSRLSAQPFGFAIAISQTAARRVSTNTVRVLLDGAAVPVQFQSSTQQLTVQHTSATIFASGSVHPVEISFADTGTPPTNQTVTLSYQVPNFRTLTPSMARAAATVDTNSAGFSVRVHQTRADATLTHNLARAEDQIRDRLIDPVTSQPYANHALGGPVFTDDNVINWDLQGGGSGNFNAATGRPDEPIPGLPGDEQSGENAAIELLGYLELKAGLVTLGVNSDDGFRLTAGPAPRDLAAYELASFDGTRGAADTAVLVYVQADGIYPVRLLYFQGRQNGSLEFFSADENGNNKWLVNDRAWPETIKVYRNARGAPVPYLDSVSPGLNATTVALNTGIEARLIDLAGTPAKMFLNRVEITPTSQTVSNITTLRYQPPAPLNAGLLYTVDLNYGAASNSWSFRTVRGPKVALIVGNPDALNPSDAGVKSRLESFGFEVYPYDDSASQISDVENSVLVITTATVGSGNVANKFADVPIPVLNWEVNIQDDYLMTFGSSGSDLGETAGQTNVIITLANHPLAAGLSTGRVSVVSSPQTFTWGVPNAATAKVIATMDDGTGHPCVYGYERGDLLVDGATPAPARRVHIFMQENAFASLTEPGLKLFDAAAGWAMNRSLVKPGSKFDPPTLQSGKIKISWTGSGSLQSAAQLQGPWTDVVNATNPLLIDPTGAARFFRIRQ
jgi:hypothetical protein